MKTIYSRFWAGLAVAVLATARLSAQTIAINEIVSSNQSVNTDEDNSYEDWVELYNYGQATVSLDGFGLTDNPGQPFKWKSPNVNLGPGQYLLVWASDKNRTTPGSPLHANFKISADGEPIVLTRADSVQVDRVDLIAIPANSSYGRQPDGTGPWKVFAAPTPGAQNAGFTGLVEPPVFSHASGLYTAPFNLVLSHSDSSATIVYTLDGSEPDLNNLAGTTFQYKNQYAYNPSDPVGPFLASSYRSDTYSAPVQIRDRSAETDKLTRMNTRQHPLYIPPQPVRKGMVVKARVYIDTFASKTVSRTFFVWPAGNPFNIPVISLQMQENHLFDYTIGVYTAGVDFDTWRQNNPTNNQGYRPEFSNYWRSGREWEYPVHLEIFEPGQFRSVVNKSGGFRIHGNNSRALAIKSLRLYARDEGNFEFDLFNEKVTDATNPDNKQFRRIMLRGEGTGGSVYYDVVFNRLMQPFFSGVTRIRPAIHFINGEYWGITAIRDRFDEHHYALHFNLNPDNIVAVDCGGNNCELDAGDNNDYASYTAMRDYIRNNDMSDPAKFALADSLLSMESFIDHMILEIFAANDSYERTYWKVRTRENNGYGDGKWRLNIQDFEASFKTNVVSLSKWASTGNSANETLFGHLLKNEGFKRQFINRYADLLNTGFRADRFKAVIDTTLAEVAPYLAEDANRYPRENFYKNSERQKLIDWADTRPGIERDTMVAYFNLDGTYNLELDVSAGAAGYVKVNTVDINPSTPGVPENTYPWTGVYFKRIPVVLKAVARKGYLFSHWSGDASGTVDSAVVNPSGNLQVVANFVKDSNYKTATYFWMMDNRIANDSPLQHITASYSANSFQAQLRYTSCLAGYPFDAQHGSWRKASMERRNAPTAINYRGGANNDLTFENSNMRGIQIKQPMRKDSLENLVVLAVPTIRLKDVKLSFAAESDGAASGLLVDYWNGSAWDTLDMPRSTFDLGSTYSLFEADFTRVTAARNNTEFRIRIRFTGDDMEADNGLRVHFNNIAVDAENDDPIGMNDPVTHRAGRLTAYPNPAQNLLVLDSDKEMQQITVMNLLGQAVRSIPAGALRMDVSLAELPASVYLVKVQWKEGEKVIRVVKQ